MQEQAVATLIGRQELQGIVDYLAKQPFGEVAGLFQTFQQLQQVTQEQIDKMNAKPEKPGKGE